MQIASRTRPLLAAMALALIAGAMAGPADAQRGANFYFGKQILMVGSSPGGGYDAVGLACLISERRIPPNLSLR